MCNLSQGIVDRVTAEVTAKMTAKFVKNMYKNNFSFEQISDITDKSVEKIKKIINEDEKVRL